MPLCYVEHTYVYVQTSFLKEVYDETSGEEVGLPLGSVIWKEKNCGKALIGRDLKDDVISTPPALGRHAIPLNQVTQCSIQPGFEHFQGLGIHFSGQLVLVHHY